MAGSKSDAFENSLLLHIFQNAAIADIGSAAGYTLPASTTAGSLYVALHTAALTDTSTMITSEVTVLQYNSYVRQAVARSAGGWTVSTNTVSNAAAITFPAMVSGTGVTVTYFSVGYANSSATGTAGTILYWGDLTSSLAVSAGITPQFAIGALVITED